VSQQAQRIADYVAHILTAISRIESYVSSFDEISFLRETIVQDAVIRNLEIIGEACRNIERADPGFPTAHPELPLSTAYEMRNALTHGYFKIDFAIVWRTIKIDLPPLRENATALLKTLGARAADGKRSP
jgi:uncharacterized protein with HEPN domain